MLKRERISLICSSVSMVSLVSAGQRRQRGLELVDLSQRVVMHQRSANRATLFLEAQSFHQPRRIHVAIANSYILMGQLFGDFGRRNAGKIKTQCRRTMRNFIWLPQAVHSGAGVS